MAKRVIGSVLELFEQINEMAPNRAKDSDGTFPSPEHHLANPNSDHEPHVVPGVGDEICTAGDYTHDPAHGADMDVLAESIRQGRDPRIKYVIRRQRMFSSYKTSTYPAWTWRPYSGAYHGHMHLSTLDAVIADSRTPWSITMADSHQLTTTNWRLLEGVIQLKKSVNDHVNPEPQRNELAFALERIEQKLDQLLAQGPGAPVEVPVTVGTFTGTVTYGSA